MIVIYETRGGIGNNLYIFAHFLANSIEYGYELVNLAFDKYSSYFEGTKVKNTKMTKEFVEGHMSEFSDISSTYADGIDMNDKTFVQVAKSKKLLVRCGWAFRDPRNFKKHASRVREVFKPLPQHCSNVSKLIGELKGNYTVLIGVHIRRSTYKFWCGGKHYYDIGVYKDRMDKLKALLPNEKVGFLICSDEQIQLKEFGRLDVFPGPKHPVEDMYSLARCDRIIGPPSTYSMWASFYGQTLLHMIETKSTPISLDAFGIMR